MVTKCLFPVAGYGTRFLPATKAIPKEMLPVVDKPLVQYGVEEAVEAGISDIVFVTGRGKSAIENHFDRNYELEDQIQGTSKEEYLNGIRAVMEACSFSYTRQVEMKGLGHAILKGKSQVGNEPFGVILADDLCYNQDLAVLAQMVELHKKHQCSIVAIEEVPLDQTEKYGVIAGEQIEEGLYRITDMVEKPKPEDAPTNLAIIGRYLLTPDIFEIIENTPPGKNNEIQITDALLTQAKGNGVLAYKFSGKRFDCGSMDGFVDATNFYYNEVYKSQG
ncbi:MAG: UTP--glucose-1-phosphate uridylyltransferase GalU [Pseudomonadales bacterium]|nr:UTP--glucose-1-phosphate uridylyltransferase GalU [Pseudomonadales bacterium]